MGPGELSVEDTWTSATPPVIVADNLSIWWGPPQTSLFITPISGEFGSYLIFFSSTISSVQVAFTVAMKVVQVFSLFQADCSLFRVSCHVDMDRDISASYRFVNR